MTPLLCELAASLYSENAVLLGMESPEGPQCALTPVVMSKTIAENDYAIRGHQLIRIKTG